MWVLDVCVAAGVPLLLVGGCGCLNWPRYAMWSAAHARAPNEPGSPSHAVAAEVGSSAAAFSGLGERPAAASLAGRQHAAAPAPPTTHLLVGVDQLRHQLILDLLHAGVRGAYSRRSG